MEISALFKKHRSVFLKILKFCLCTMFYPQVYAESCTNKTKNLLYSLAQLYSSSPALKLITLLSLHTVSYFTMCIRSCFISWLDDI
ncbi:hypothetical protein AB205_0033710 [Aquarana catesbeiana]|uniref:Uncharacterized protein n=1 Tax=Aquarana catesbeiana TaxID=8400 RepID=A0A2G9RL59_AQUCT|nr:hypothetical protein AB205_0033710 [Aquarana catesbeiana]